MKELRPLDYGLLWELIKNSRRSDRELARVLGSSQPTVTRRRAFLEKELIDGYTAIPKWEKLGYEILALTFVKTKTILGLEEKYTAAHEKGRKWLMDQPNVIMGGGCRGMGMDGFFISVHKSYTEFNEFMFQHKRKVGDQVEDVQTILVNLAGKEILKPLNLKYLAETK
jgi:DNA-binding Lrp family transcriptional regulator